MSVLITVTILHQPFTRPDGTCDSLNLNAICLGLSKVYTIYHVL